MATAASRRYGRAVFELAAEDRRIDEWRRRLATLRDLLADPDVAAVLSNPTIPGARRMELIAEAEPEVGPEVTNLARLLIETNRVHQVGEIAAEFDRLADEAQGLLPATVTTAVELSAQDRERIAAELSQRMGKEVRLDVVVDARILGGLKLQYGDHLVDVSVATRLQQLRRRLAGAS